MKKLKYLIFAFVAMVMMATGVFAAGEKVKITIIDNIYQCPEKYKTASGKVVKLTDAQLTNKLVYTIPKGTKFSKSEVDKINRWINKRRAVYLKYLKDSNAQKKYYIDKAKIVKAYSLMPEAEMFIAKLPSEFLKQKFVCDTTVPLEKVAIKSVVCYTDRFYYNYKPGAYEYSAPDKARKFETVQKVAFLKKGDKILPFKSDNYIGCTYKGNTLERLFSATGSHPYRLKHEKNWVVSKAGQIYFVCRNYQVNKYKIKLMDSVVLDDNDKSKSIIIRDAFYDQEIVLPKCPFTKKGYRFKSWECKGKAYLPKSRVSKLTAKDNGEVVMSAVWEPITYQIKYKVTYDGEKFEIISPSLLYNMPSKYTIEQHPIIKLGELRNRLNKKNEYTFLGWKSNVFSGRQNVSSISMKKDQTGTVYFTAYFKHK